MRTFLINTTILVLILIIFSGCSQKKQQEDLKTEEETASHSVPGDPLIRVGPKTATADEIIQYVRKDTTRRHELRTLGAGAVVTRAVEEMVRNFLIMNDIEENHMNRPPYVNYRNYLEDSIIDKHFRERVLPGKLEVSPGEVEEVAPKRWKELKLRQVTLPTWEEAEKVRKRIESGEDFISLIREFSTGPGRLTDGLYVDYVPEKTSRFNQEDLDHLFGLEVGQYSRVLPTKIGFAICRVEEVREIPEGEKQKTLRKIKGSIYNEKVAKLMEATKESIVIKDLEEKEFDRLAQLHLQGKGDSRKTLVFETGDRKLTLETIIHIAEKAPDPMPDLTFVYKVSKYWKTALKMRDVIVGAYLGRSGGVEVSGEDRERVDAYIYENLLEFHYGQTVGDITVTVDEARTFFNENPEVFFGKGSVELYDIQTGVKSIADEVKEKAISGRDFAALARIYSIERESAEKGGYRGVVTEADMDPEVAEAAFALGEGEISQVVLSRSGYHVLKVVRKIPPESYTFDEREKQVVKRYQDMKREEAREKYIGGLKEKYPVQVDWDGIKKVIEAMEKEA